MNDRARKGLIAAVAAAAAAAGWVVPGRLVLSATPSVEGVLFWRAGAVEPGRYVTFPGRAPCREDLPLLKRAVCGPGAELVASPKGVLCEGEWLGRAKPTARDGHELRPFLYRGPVPDGVWYVAGTHKDSCDSRYFGFVLASELTPLVKLW